MLAVSWALSCDVSQDSCTSSCWGSLPHSMAVGLQKWSNKKTRYEACDIFMPWPQKSHSLISAVLYCFKESRRLVRVQREETRTLALHGRVSMSHCRRTCEIGDIVPIFGQYCLPHKGCRNQEFWSMSCLLIIT